MGLHASLWKDNEEVAQVKCWPGNCGRYGVGDDVPTVHNHRTYYVVLRDEDGIMFVRDCMIESITIGQGQRETVPVFDKYGTKITEGIIEWQP